MNDNHINIEIDGKKVHAEQGATIIEAADMHHVYIPRFCYHKKLTVAANCRMCLVEVEGGRKALPACATPITEGMKVKTRTKLARQAQQAVMEFLLINHPLDCPICDQGGQCELQDLAMGYGHDTSRYDDRKRVVKDKNLGPLISTDMTRCILCTRCVRFATEVAGLPELGTIGRGEHTEISTYIEGAIQSEVSGNMIDVCPVGALTAKPFRYTARAWELQQRPTIAAHDCLGSNINVHSMQDQVKRIVPHANEAINEVWLSDRDRFSYVALNSEQRLQQPLIKKAGNWQEVDWTTALEVVASQLVTIKQAHGAEQLATLISPNTTIEEQYLLQKIWRELGSNNIDHRIRQTDFSDQQDLPTFPSLGLPLAELENIDTCLLIGSDIQREQPLAAVRLLKASNNKATIISINPYDYAFNFTVAIKSIQTPQRMVRQLAAVVKVLAKDKILPTTITDLLADIEIDATTQRIAEKLSQGQQPAIILGAIAQNSEQAAALRYFAQLIAEFSGASVGELNYGANTAGAWLTGCVPHRAVANTAIADNVGIDAQQLFRQGRKAYLLFNLEPEFDCADPQQAIQALMAAEFVVSCSPFISTKMRDYADVILPITPFTETSGTFINCNAAWQSFSATVLPLAEARPGWKVLRVLGNFLNLSGFDYTHSEQIRDQLQQTAIEPTHQINRTYCPPSLTEQQTLLRIGDWPLYRGDNIVRRSEPLQATLDAELLTVKINPNTARQLDVGAAEVVLVSQTEVTVELPVSIDVRVAEGCVCIAAGTTVSEKLGAAFSAVQIRKKI